MSRPSHSTGLAPTGTPLGPRLAGQSGLFTGVHGLQFGECRARPSRQQSFDYEFVETPQISRVGDGSRHPSRVNLARSVSKLAQMSWKSEHSASPAPFSAHLSQAVSGLEQHGGLPRPASYPLIRLVSFTGMDVFATVACSTEAPKTFARRRLQRDSVVAGEASTRSRTERHAPGVRAISRACECQRGSASPIRRHV